MSRTSPDKNTEVCGYVTRVGSLADEGDATGHELCMSLRGAFLSLQRQADYGFAPFGLTGDQFVVLAVLNDGSMLTQAEVCRRTYTDPNTMGAMLALLQRRGLVRRMKHSEDGRVRTAMLTAKGKKVVSAAYAGREAFRNRLAGVFTAEECASFLGFLKRVIQELSPPPRRRKRLKNKIQAGATA